MCRVLTEHIRDSGLAYLLCDVLKQDDLTQNSIDRILSCLQQCVMPPSTDNLPGKPIFMQDVILCDEIVQSLVNIYKFNVAGRPVQELIAGNLLVSLVTPITASLVAKTIFNRFIDQILSGSGPMCLPYLQMLLLHVIRTFSSPPCLNAFFGSDTPIERLLPILACIADDVYLHEDVAVPGLVVLEGFILFYTRSRWLDPIIQDQIRIVLTKLRHRNFSMTMESIVSIYELMLNQNNAVITRTLCDEYFAVIDEIDASIAIQSLYNFAMKNTTVINMYCLWRVIIQKLVAFNNKSILSGKDSEHVVEIMRKAVRPIDYPGLVVLMESLVLLKDIREYSPAIRCKAIETIRILTFRIRSPEHPRFILSLKKNNLIVSFLQHAEFISKTSTCLLETKATIQLLDIWRRFQVGSRLKCSELVVGIALSVFKRQRTCNGFLLLMANCIEKAVMSIYESEQLITEERMGQIVIGLRDCAFQHVFVREAVLNVYMRFVCTYTTSFRAGVMEMPPDLRLSMLNVCKDVFSKSDQHTYACFYSALMLYSRLIPLTYNHNNQISNATDLVRCSDTFKNYISQDITTQRVLNHAIEHARVVERIMHIENSFGANNTFIMDDNIDTMI